jgi:tetratricopeptide (TPR) repeat protein
MNSKSKLKAFFDSKQDNQQYIEKYEENLAFFNDLLKNGHKEDIEFVIPIKMYKYADPLNLTGNYSQALEVLAEIDNDLDKIKGQSKWYNQYLEGMIFLKGVCFARLKRYKDSNVEFEKILRKNPDNDKYIDWFKSNKENIVADLMNKIMYIGIGFYVLIMIIGWFGYKIENLIIRDIGFVIGLLAFVTSYIWRKVIKKRDVRLS